MAFHSGASCPIRAAQIGIDYRYRCTQGQVDEGVSAPENFWFPSLP